MKRISGFFIAVMLLFGLSGVSEQILPAHETALPLYEILLSCDTFYNFDGVPDEAFAREAVYRLNERTATEGEPTPPEEAYKMLFSEGEYVFPEEPEEYLPALPVQIEIENAVESGIGTVIVSLRVQKDYGFGMEFWGYVDIHILPDETAPFGAYVTRVFIPE